MLMSASVRHSTTITRLKQYARHLPDALEKSICRESFTCRSMLRPGIYCRWFVDDASVCLLGQTHKRVESYQLVRKEHEASIDDAKKTFVQRAAGSWDRNSHARCARVSFSLCHKHRKFAFFGKCTVLVALNFYRPCKYQNLALFTGLNLK